MFLGLCPKKAIIIFCLFWSQGVLAFEEEDLGIRASSEPSKSTEPRVQKGQKKMRRGQNAKTPDEEPILDRLLNDKYIEETRQSVVGQVFRLADRIDSLFGDSRYEDRSNQSTLKIRQDMFLLDGQYSADYPSINLNLHLPNLKELQKRWMGKLVDEDNGGEGSGNKNDETEHPWRLNQETGIVVAWPLNYFSRFRLRKDFHTGRFVHSFYEQIGWSKKDEWEEKTSLVSDYGISENLLFRFLNEKEWGMTAREFRTNHGPSLLNQLSEISAISYDFRYGTEIDGRDLYSRRVSLGATYRSRLSLPWIFYEINPEMAWERDTGFKALYNLTLKIEFVFGNL